MFKSNYFSSKLLTCEYCGIQKVRLVRSSTGDEKILMYPQNVPIRRTITFLGFIAKILELDQIWVCHYCMEKLK
jgi:hypothetical protein